MLFLVFLYELCSIERHAVRDVFSDGSGYRAAIAFNGILALALQMAGL